MYNKNITKGIFYELSYFKQTNQLFIYHVSISFTADKHSPCCNQWLDTQVTNLKKLKSNLFEKCVLIFIS